MIKGILFNGDMVRAILDGRKTVTRRVAKKIPPKTHRININYFFGSNEKERWKGFECHSDSEYIIYPPYQPGDILYVRETWCRVGTDVDKMYFEHSGAMWDGMYLYKADGYDLSDIGRWRPSIHMPKEAARIWLKVTDVRAEQLKDITAEQILKEGVNKESIDHYINQMQERAGEWVKAAYLFKFSQLWDATINKKQIQLYGWDANPWVWVIEFERCERPKEI